MPTAFISYSWDSEAHKNWVRDLATRLRGDGLDVTLDRWHAQPGDQLPRFMETSIRESDFVLIVCTPYYKERADRRAGGVGYEGDIITGEVFNGAEQRKFIPLLRADDWAQAAPSWLAGKYYIDMRGDPYDEAMYSDLSTTVFNRREPPPPVGKRRTFLPTSAVVKGRPMPHMQRVLLNGTSVDETKKYHHKTLALATDVANSSYVKLLADRWLELIREAVPGANRIAVLVDAMTGPWQLASIKRAAEKLRIELQVLEVRNSGELDQALGAGVKGGSLALVQLSSPLWGLHDVKKIAEFTMEHRLAAISFSRTFAVAGGLMAYGPDPSEYQKRSHIYIDKRVRNPPISPIEQPTKFVYVINLKTAKALGLTIPQSLLVRADEVIQ